MNSIARGVRSVLLLLIRGYQYLISPYLGAHCRFYPSCSEYAHQVLCVHGLGKGVYYIVLRLSRCHAGHAGGCDPIPPASH